MIPSFLYFNCKCSQSGDKGREHAAALFLLIRAIGRGLYLAQSALNLAEIVLTKIIRIQPFFTAELFEFCVSN